MSENGKEPDGRRIERALYQRGQQVAKEVRHKVGDQIVGRRDEYNAQDVMSAIFYMHRQTIAQIGTAAEEYDFSEEASQKLADLLTDVRGNLGPSTNVSDSDQSES